MTTDINDGADQVHAREGAHVNIVRLDLGGMTLLAILLFGVIVAACGVVMGLDIAERSTLQRAFENDQRAWRYAELKYDELNLTLRRAGIALPGDYRQGVGGNLDPEAFRKPKEK